MKLHIAGLWQASPSSLLKGPKGDCYKREGGHFYDIPMKKCGHIYVVTSADVDNFLHGGWSSDNYTLSNIPNIIKFAQIFLAFFHMYSNGMELV